jgi:bisphosphoglycerate-dependent phosphoglycerate mutase
MELFLVRHGQAVWSSEVRYASSIDLGLTADGQAEARRAQSFSGQWLDLSPNSTQAG